MTGISLERKRKFVIASMALFMTFVGLLAGFVEGSTWAESVRWIVGLYGGVEALEGVGHAVADAYKNRSA